MGTLRWHAVKPKLPALNGMLPRFHAIAPWIARNGDDLPYKQLYLNHRMHPQGNSSATLSVVRVAPCLMQDHAC
jgi:hypothetical protein